jgi:peptidoglycan/xylan/chitin deacetylase (PgdA/CDA1 family)
MRQPQCDPGKIRSFYQKPLSNMPHECSFTYGLTRDLEMTAFPKTEHSPQPSNGVGLILMYHRIGELQSDPWGLAVSPRHFVEHLEVLRKHSQPRPLAQTVNAIKHQLLPWEKTLVVTFDDGYADNLYIAAPLLDRYDVPATVFLTSGYIGSDREFWWDALERILLGPEVLPAELRITAAGRSSEWSLGEARYYAQHVRRRDRKRFAGRHGKLSGRYKLYRAVHRLLQPLDDEERLNVLNDLSDWGGVTMSARESHRCLSPDDVRALARRELIELGAHTVTHPALPALPEASQREEIRQCKLELEQLLGRPVTSFAYPYGQYAAETAALVREEGFSWACSTQAGFVTQQTGLFCLPRVRVEDWDGERLTRILSDWFSVGA